MNPYSFCMYRQNISIIKNFFSRPLTLITAISFAVATIFYSVAELFSQSNSINVRFDIISIMLSIAFFLLYFLSKSKKPDVSFRAPVILIQTVSIINIVLAGIALTMLAFLFLLALVIPTSPISKMLNVILLSAAITSPILLVQLFLYIFFLVFAGSIKKSVSSIYLRKKGAGAFGVTTIIFIIFNIALTAASFILFPVLISQYSEALQSLAEFTGNAEVQSYIANYFANPDIFSSYTNITSIVCFCIKIIPYILLALFTFSYKSYINKYTNNINVFECNQTNPERPVQPFTESPVLHETPTENSAPFLADAVFNNIPDMAPPIPSQPNTNIPQSGVNPNTISFLDENQNPYTQPPLPEQIPFCPYCGNRCNPSDHHCGACGNKLN